MFGSNGLTYSVSDTGIFIHFIASDGSETQIDALTVLDCSSAMTNMPLVHWFHERLEEAAANEITETRRWNLVTAIDEIAAAKEVELRRAEAAGAVLDANVGEAVTDAERWLERAEMALDGSAVLLTKEAFLALLTLAKKGAGLRGASVPVSKQAWDVVASWRQS
jgi:hypothetical protein